MSLIGLVLALIAILGGNMIEGGHPSALLDLPAFLIVIGGTIGAALTQFPFSVVGSTMKRFKWLLSPLKLDMHEQAQLLETLAGNARRSGMLALEGMIDEIKDPFLKKGVQMMVDGYEKTKIHEVLENEIDYQTRIYRLVLDPSRRLVVVSFDGDERLLLLGEGQLLPTVAKPARKPKTAA